MEKKISKASLDIIRTMQQGELTESVIYERIARFAKGEENKQVLLRLSPSLWDEIAAWADEDFRSINSQIEFLLSEAVRQRRKK